MANRHNSTKKIRSDERKYLSNRTALGSIRSLKKSVLTLINGKDKKNAEQASRQLFSKLDKAIRKGILKENTVNRTKSRLAKRLQAIQA